MAWVTSTTIAASGVSPVAEVRAPPPPPKAISSCEVATAVTATPVGPAAIRRSASSTTKAPIRLSRLRLARRPFGSRSTQEARTPASPTRIRAAVSAFDAAPMSIQRSATLETFSRSSLSSR